MLPFAGRPTAPAAGRLSSHCLAILLRNDAVYGGLDGSLYVVPLSGKVRSGPSNTLRQGNFSPRGRFVMAHLFWV